jgi:hypothetical protein
VLLDQTYTNDVPNAVGSDLYEFSALFEKKEPYRLLLYGFFLTEAVGKKPTFQLQAEM